MPWERLIMKRIFFCSPYDQPNNYFRKVSGPGFESWHVCSSLSRHNAQKVLRSPSFLYNKYRKVITQHGSLKSSYNEVSNAYTWNSTPLICIHAVLLRRGVAYINNAIPPFSLRSVARNERGTTTDVFKPHVAKYTRLFRQCGENYDKYRSLTFLFS
jgi:hypothetical protein